MNNATPVIECRDLNKTYHDADVDIQVLQNIQLTIRAGEKVAIIGPSGSGKSTLLHLLGGLDQPSSGTVLVNGENINTLSETERCRLRNRSLGFVYQFHHLLPEFTALENVCMPLLIRGTSTDFAQQHAKLILERVGLGDRLKHKPGQLSGGERQRTAIARGLVSNPACLLADEPTGNLDTETADQVYNTLRGLNETLNTSLLIVTHDISLVQRMDRVLSLRKGMLTDITSEVTRT